MKSEAINELAGALAKAQSEIRNAAFNRVNPHFRNKYADLAAVFDAIRAPLSKNGLSVSQQIEYRDGHLMLVTALLHASGQWIESTYPLPANAKPQEIGSALTYGRRYSISSIAGIAADEDDDAEIAAKESGSATINGNGNGRISPQQVETLQSVIVEVGADLPRLLAYFKVARLDDLPTGKYDSAVAMLNAKRAQQQ